MIQKIVQVPVAATYGPAFKRAAPTSTPMVCRFFPNCSNVQCTFYHPKPCRFGMQCMNKSVCTFYHPAVPSKSQLKWSATSKQASTHISQRQFDAGVAESLTSSWEREDHYISVMVYWFLSLEYRTGTRHWKQWQHSGRNNYFLLNILKRIGKFIIFLKPVCI